MLLNHRQSIKTAGALLGIVSTVILHPGLLWSHQAVAQAQIPVLGIPLPGSQELLAIALENLTKGPIDRKALNELLQYMVQLGFSSAQNPLGIISNPQILLNDFNAYLIRSGLAQNSDQFVKILENLVLKETLNNLNLDWSKIHNFTDLDRELSKKNIPNLAALLDYSFRAATTKTGNQNYLALNQLLKLILSTVKITSISELPNLNTRVKAVTNSSIDLVQIVNGFIADQRKIYLATPPTPPNPSPTINVPPPASAPSTPPVVVTPPPASAPSTPPVVVTPPPASAPSTPPVVVTPPPASAPSTPPVVVTPPPASAPSTPPVVVTPPPASAPSTPPAVVTPPPTSAPSTPPVVVTPPPASAPSTPPVVVTPPPASAPSTPPVVVTPPPASAPSTPPVVVTPPPASAPSTPPAVVTPPPTSAPSTPAVVIKPPRPTKTIASPPTPNQPVVVTPPSVSQPVTNAPAVAPPARPTARPIRAIRIN
jgi:hypothetical protein